MELISLNLECIKPYVTQCNGMQLSLLLFEHRSVEIDHIHAIPLYSRFKMLLKYVVYMKKVYNHFIQMFQCCCVL